MLRRGQGRGCHAQLGHARPPSEQPGQADNRRSAQRRHRPGQRRRAGGDPGQGEDRQPDHAQHQAERGPHPRARRRPAGGHELPALRQAAQAGSGHARGQGGVRRRRPPAIRPARADPGRLRGQAVRKLVARVGGSQPDQAPAGVAGVATAPAAAGALPVVAAGLGFLLLRPQVAALPLGRPALAAGYLALGLAAAGAPAALRRRRPPGGTAARPAVPAGPADAGAVLLGLAAAVAEEALFRQAMYRTLAARGGAVLAVTATAAAFALVHLPFYGMAAFPVDLGAGLLFGWQRWSSGSWTVPAATHAAANLMVVIRLG